MSDWVLIDCCLSFNPQYGNFFKRLLVGFFFFFFFLPLKQTLTWRALMLSFKPALLDHGNLFASAQMLEMSAVV